MDKATLIRDSAVASDQYVICDCLPEHLDFEDIRDDLLRLAVDVGMNECDVVVACDDVPESRQAFFYSLYCNSVR